MPTNSELPCVLVLTPSVPMENTRVHPQDIGIASITPVNSHEDWSMVVDDDPINDDDENTRLISQLREQNDLLQARLEDLQLENTRLSDNVGSVVSSMKHVCSVYIKLDICI